MPMGGKNIIDMTGMRFGRLFIVGRAESSGTGHAKWLCVCDCGGKVTAHGSNIRRGITASCGCLHREATGRSSRKHGQCKTEQYLAWERMKKRCSPSNKKESHLYFDRGILVCPEWSHDFQAFIDHIGEMPPGVFQVDRIDNDKGYQPGNVRWATPRQNARNRRGTYRWHINGKWYEAAIDASEEFGVSRKTICNWVDSASKPDCYKEERYE